MVTVLLATWRGDRYLPGLTDSLLQQDWTGFRVLWQDDGGDSPALPPDERFIPGAHHGQRFGAAGNFFDLMRQAKGYIALCDQDDVWHADRLSRGMAVMERAEAAYGEDTPILIHSDCRLIDTEGRTLQDSFFRHQGWDPGATTLNRLLVQNNVTGCTILMNESLRALVCAHIPNVPVLHDWWIALLAAACGRIVCLPEPLVDYRQHGQNVIGASKRSLLRRGAAALAYPARAKARIHLTYDMARLLESECSTVLPETAQRCLAAYLATETLPKWQRVSAVQRSGCTMQSTVTRLGQILFG